MAGRQLGARLSITIATDDQAVMALLDQAALSWFIERGMRLSEQLEAARILTASAIGKSGEKS